MPVIGSGGSTVNVAGQASMRVVAPVARLVTGGGSPGPSGSGVVVASVVLYCPTLTVDDLTPSDGDTMYWVDHTPNLADPDAMTGLSDWTGMEEFTWTEGWATDNDPTNVLILTDDDSWRPAILAQVTPTGFEAIDLLGGQPVVVGCGGGGGDFTGSIWTGWNIGDGQGGAPDPTQPATYIVPPGVTADQVRIIDRTGNGDHGTLADWLSGAPIDADIAAAIAAGAVVLVGLHLPLAIEFAGGSFTGADTATLPAASGAPVGTRVLWTAQVDGLNNDIWVHEGGGDFVRSSPSALRLERSGTLIVSQTNPIDSNRAQVFRITGANAVEELVVTTSQVNALINAATADLATESYVDDAVAPLATSTEVDDVAADLAESRIIDVESVVAVSAVDGTATTLQPIRRADDAPADGDIPEHWLAKGSPIDVEDWAVYGALVILPGPDAPASPAEWSKLYRVMPVGTPWELVTPPTNAQVFVNQGTDNGFPLWWSVTGAGRLVPMQMSAHNVRLDRHPTINNPSTVQPWTDLNEMVTVLARSVQWEVIDVDTDWAMNAGPSHITVVTADDVTVTLPEPVDPTPGSAVYGFAYNRPYRVVSLTAGPVVIEDHLGFAVATLSAAGQSVELIHNGVDWFVYGGPSATATHTHDTLANIATARLLGRVSSGPGDSEELTVPQARTLLAQPEVLLHSETVAADAASKQYDVTGWNKIRVEFTGRGTRNSTIIGLYATLNGNTGSVYSTNAAAMTTSWALGSVPAAATNTDRRGMVKAEIELMSGAWKEGMSWGTNHGSTATVGQAPSWVGLLSSITAAVTTIELKMQLDNIAAGSRIRIIGIEAT